MENAKTIERKHWMWLPALILFMGAANAVGGYWLRPQINSITDSAVIDYLVNTAAPLILTFWIAMRLGEPIAGRFPISFILACTAMLLLLRNVTSFSIIYLGAFWFASAVVNRRWPRMPLLWPLAIIFALTLLDVLAYYSLMQEAVNRGAAPDPRSLVMPPEFMVRYFVNGMIKGGVLALCLWLAQRWSVATEAAAA